MLDFINDLIEIYDSRFNPKAKDEFELTLANYWKKYLIVDDLVVMAFNDQLITRKELNEYVKFTQDNPLIKHAIEFSFKYLNKIDKPTLDEYVYSRVGKWHYEN